MYKCLTKNEFIVNDYSIKPIDRSCIEPIRIWRNKQMDVLRQKNIITSQQQSNYFEKNVWPLYNDIQPNQLLFSYYKKDEFLGYGGLVNISWEDQRAEMSFLINPSYTLPDDLYDELFSSFISLIKKVVFDHLKFHKLFTETYAHRTSHISILEKNGFILDGVLRDHIIINGKFTNSLMHSILKNV